MLEREQERLAREREREWERQQRERERQQWAERDKLEQEERARFYQNQTEWRETGVKQTQIASQLVSNLVHMNSFSNVQAFRAIQSSSASSIRPLRPMILPGPVVETVENLAGDDFFEQLQLEDALVEAGRAQDEATRAAYERDERARARREYMRAYMRAKRATMQSQTYDISSSDSVVETTAGQGTGGAGSSSLEADEEKARGGGGGGQSGGK